MQNKYKISPFQLICILYLCRLFAVITMSVRDAEFGSILLSYPISAVLQIVLIALAQKLSYSHLGASPLATNCGKICHWGLLVGYLVSTAIVGASTLWRFGDFFSVSFYNGRYKMWILLLMALAGGFAVIHGLEALARTAPIALLLVGVALAVLFVGAVPEINMRYLPVLETSFDGTVNYSALLVGANTDIIPLLLLLPFTSTGKVKMVASGVWVCVATVITATMAVLITLAVGVYAGTGTYPVYTLAQAGSVPFMTRLDSVLMGVWVFLGLIKFAIYLFITTMILSEFAKKQLNATAVIITSILMWVIAIVLDFGITDKESILPIALGSITILGTLILPLISKIFSKKVVTT